MYKTDFKWGDINIQLSQFSTNVDSTDVSVGKIIEILSYFEKIYGKKLLVTQVLKSTKLLSVILASNATRKRSFSVMKHYSFLTNTTTGNSMVKPKYHASYTLPQNP